MGAEIGRRKLTLIYGGARIGLMGEMARTVQTHGGKVIGIIPEKIQNMGIAYTEAEELVVTPDLRERKAAMESRADAFVALPGGFGTLEEILEVLTLKQLNFHQKPIVFLNTNGFYDPLLDLFEHIYTHRFAKPDYRQLYQLIPDVPGLFAYLDSYQPTGPINKIFKP
jgi:uncharacterized protein (TIGR00730 family)